MNQVEVSRPGMHNVKPAAALNIELSLREAMTTVLAEVPLKSKPSS